MPPQPAALTGLASDPEPSGRGATRIQVAAAVRNALLTGRFIPGKAVTLRGLAKELGVSPMPVREVIQRLAAEKALEIQPNGRVQVPQMSRTRFDEILKTRLLLEPELAAMALGGLSAPDVRELERIDEHLDESLKSGDAEAYMQLNHAFHFRLYEAAGSEIMLPMVESLWLQFAPFMRTVYGRVGTVSLVDQHREAIAAITAKDTERLRRAIAADIADGMGIIGRENLAGP
ncbi:GntR family transcriptional regulator [Roseibium sp. RKSG952]|uniref:GntR family transcriptional regulator n=1 Tax=Roseibium sp. RKSG952 TaxID=2529384 RepID=UPI001AD90495